MSGAKRKRNLSIAAAFLIVLAGLGVAQSALDRAAAAQAKNNAQAPRFEVDPMWPKPLPNHWLLGSTIGVWVDSKDQVWIIHRSSATLDATERGAEANPPVAECCKGAPPVLDFDAAGNLVKHWGGPGTGFEWPSSNHGIFVDQKNQVWIGGNGPGDSQILKFTIDGKFLAQYGKANARKAGGEGAAGQVPGQQQRSRTTSAASRRSSSMRRRTKRTWRTATSTNGWRFSTATRGKLKRHWGAYGNKPDDANLGPYKPDAPPAQQFRNPVHCADVSNDGIVYVCDRVNNRIQVFTKEGKFVKEQFYAKNTLAAGVGVGHRLLARSATAVHVHRRRSERRRCTSSSASRSNS